MGDEGALDRDSVRWTGRQAGMQDISRLRLCSPPPPLLLLLLLLRGKTQAPTVCEPLTAAGGSAQAHAYIYVHGCMAWVHALFSWPAATDRRQTYPHTYLNNYV